MKVYTATSNQERSKAYREGKFFLPDHANGGVIIKDSGDMGSGLYTSTWLSRAKNYGSAIFRLEVDSSQIITINNPYDENAVLPDWLKCILYNEKKHGSWIMNTVQRTREDRTKFAALITKEALKRGILGLKWRDEIVLFSNQPIVAIWEVKRNGHPLSQIKPNGE